MPPSEYGVRLDGRHAPPLPPPIGPTYVIAARPPARSLPPPSCSNPLAHGAALRQAHQGEASNAAEERASERASQEGSVKEGRKGKGHIWWPHMLRFRDVSPHNVMQRRNYQRRSLLFGAKGNSWYFALWKKNRLGHMAMPWTN